MLGKVEFGPTDFYYSINKFFPPVSCEMPPAPENGRIESINTTEEVVFGCNPGFVLVGQRRATCMSPDGISAVGTWTPDPAHLVCNGKLTRI